MMDFTGRLRLTWCVLEVTAGESVPSEKYDKKFAQSSRGSIAPAALLS